MRTHYALLLVFLLPACSGDAPVAAPVDEGPAIALYPGAEAAGLDGAAITTLVARVDSGDFGQIRSLLLSRSGTLVIEEYFRGVLAEDANQIYSVTKSITSALVGVAVHDGLIGLDDTLPQYLPDHQVPPEKAGITVNDLLTMTAGIQWDEWSSPYGTGSNSATRISSSPDWVQFMLDLPMASDPGTGFTYSSGVSMLLGAVLQQATRETVHQYAAGILFETTSLAVPVWDEGPRGLTNTGWGLHMTPRALLAIGEMFEQGGQLEGRQIVHRSWVDLSTSQHVTTNNGFAYGFQWWRFRDGDPTIASLPENDVYFAWGYGGQFIFVIPQKDMVIVSTAGNFEDSSPMFDLLRVGLLPAVR